MADAKDILGIPKTTSTLSLGEKRTVRASKDGPPKKLDRVSREVYALTGGLPPIIPSVTVDLKQRYVSSKKISWQWLPFTTSARSDNLQLFHWTRVEDGVAPTGDYAFAKYNKAVDIVRYTDEEYNKHLEDPNWTKQETDQLFDLCEQFDLRFVIIADRICPSRTVEDLKQRYYTAAKSILLARATSPEDVADHTLVKDVYNMQYEVERKRALGVMLSQSRQQDREDAEVLAEARRIAEARLKASGDAETASAAQSAGDMAVRGPQTPARPTTPPSASGTVGTTINATSGPRAPRVYLRGAFLGQVIHSTCASAGTRNLKRIEQTLEELGVRAKPKVPTEAVCREHVELRKDILNLLNLQKQLQWKETEVAVLRDNPYADVPTTPSTPKKMHRGGEHDRTMRGADVDYSGDKLGKRESKRKIPRQHK